MTRSNKALLVFIGVLIMINLICTIWIGQLQSQIVDTLKPVVSVANVEKYNRDAWCYEMKAEYKFTQGQLSDILEVLDDLNRDKELKIKLEAKNDGY